LDIKSYNTIPTITEGRVENKDITDATLENFVKSLKVFCDSADLDIPWKKITRGLLKGRQAANDRAPTLEEIQRLVDIRTGE
jgi:hypothetical protein